jgi:hypothetical protein
VAAEVRVVRLTATRTTTFASRTITSTLMSPIEPRNGKMARSVSPVTVRYVTTATPTRIPAAAAPLGREVVPHEAEEEGWQELRDVGGTQEREEHQFQGVAEVNTRVTSATTGPRNFARVPAVS